MTNVAQGALDRARGLYEHRRLRAREDYKLYALPGLEIAVSMGATVINNLILLGAYVAITGLVSPELVEGVLHRRYEGNEKVLARNLDAFRRGLEMGKTAKQ